MVWRQDLAGAAGEAAYSWRAAENCLGALLWLLDAALHCGAGYGPGAMGALTQLLLGARISLVLKPHCMPLLRAGDTLKKVADQYDSSVTSLCTYSPDYDRWPQHDPLPVGVVFDVLAIRPSSLPDPFQSLLVPAYRPSKLLQLGASDLPAGAACFCHCGERLERGEACNALASIFIDAEAKLYKENDLNLLEKLSK